MANGMWAEGGAARAQASRALAPVPGQQEGEPGVGRLREPGRAQLEAPAGHPEEARGAKGCGRAELGGAPLRRTGNPEEEGKVPTGPAPCPAPAGNTIRPQAW